MQRSFGQRSSGSPRSTAYFSPTILAAFAAFTLAAFCASAYAHSGGSDDNGCHTNHKTGEYPLPNVVRAKPLIVM
nr:YHYH domain-containing protein [Mesorhizobium sp. LMG 17147]